MMLPETDVVISVAMPVVGSKWKRSGVVVKVVPLKLMVMVIGPL